MTSVENLIFSIRPPTFVVTSASLWFLTTAEISIPADSRVSRSTSVRTATSLSETASVRRSETGRQMPMLLSGGRGFQSTKPIVKSPGRGGWTATARALGPSTRRPLTSNSWTR